MIQDTSSSDVTQENSIGIKLTVIWLQSCYKNSFQIFEYFWIDVYRNDVLTSGNNIAHLLWTRTENYSCGFPFIAVNHEQKLS